MSYEYNSAENADRWHSKLIVEETYSMPLYQQWAP